MSDIGGKLSTGRLDFNIYGNLFQFYNEKMRKLKSCSFCFFIKSLTEKYFLFLFISAVFIANGLFVSITSASTIVNTDIIEDTTWALDGSPYLINTGIFVFEGITLTIDPGVVVKFNLNTWPYLPSLGIFGKLIANGAENDPIYFTSNYDDIGGSTDEDYESCYYENYDEEGNPLGEEICEIVDLYEPYAGDWGGLYFISSNGSSLKNVFFRYADDTLSFESSSVNFENLNLGDNIYGLTGYNDSHVEILGGVFNNLEEEAFSFFNDSSLILKNITLSDILSYSNSAISIFNNSSLEMSGSSIISYDGFVVFNDSSLTATDLSLECENDGIVVFNNSSLNLFGGNISCLNDGLLMFNKVTANISGIKITDALDAGIVAFTGTEPNLINITESEITSNNYGFIVFNSPISANQNSIHDNLSGAITYDPLAPIIFDFTNNYWGDLSGPTHSSNPNGMGDTISNNILFTPFLTSDPLVECCSSIIFVPGFEGSRLYEKRNNGNLIQRWEAGIASFTDVNSLYLNNLGNSIKDIFVGDVIERTNYIPDSINTSLYKSIVVWFNEIKESSIINDFFIFPYDWRLDVSDLAQNGSISTNNEILNLKNKIIELSQSSKTNKITLIGHSNGGLLIKKTIQLLKDSGQENLIDKVIVVGSPQLGTPKAIGATLHGDAASLGGGFVLSSEKARSWGENMPGAYGLIPSKKYYQKVGPIVSFDESLNNNWISLYSNTLDYEEQNHFLTGQDGRRKPASDNLEFPTILNKFLLNKANELHDSIDNLEFPENIKFYEIAGIGVPTLEKLTYKSRLLGTIPVDYKLNFSCDGDKTVVSQSAIDSALNPYYLNLFNYQKDTGNKFSHSDLMENPEIINLISNITTDTNKDIPHMTTTKPSLSECKFKIFGIFSPADLDVYDLAGRHTGIDRDISTNNFMAFDTEIPGSDFFMIGDQKYVVVPDEGEYNVKIDGTGTGVFTLDILTQANDQIINNTSYNNVPVNPKLEAQIVVSSNNPEEVTLKIDSNGDGKIDQQVSPNNEENPLYYLEVIRKIIIELSLPKKIEKPLLQKIDKIARLISNNKHYYLEKNIKKFMKKIESDRKFIKKITQQERDNLVEQINNLLNSF